MQDILNKIFDEYKKFLDEVWQVIRVDDDPTRILNDFNRNIEVYLKQCWDPLLTTAEKLKENINELINSNQDKQ